MRIGGLARLVSATAIALALACAPASAHRAKIRIGSGVAYPPFNYVDANGQLQGFEIDLARAVCVKLAVECEFIAQEWEGLMPALLVGKFDAIFASMSITEERLKQVAFTDPYYFSPAMFVRPKATARRPLSPEAMAGLTIGAQTATTGARYLQQVYAPAGTRVKLYRTLGEANLELAAGRIDAVLGDKLALMHWLETAPNRDCCQAVGPDLDDPAYFGSGVGAAVRKNDVELKAMLDRGIAAARADGDYERITAKYFPFSLN